MNQDFFKFPSTPHLALLDGVEVRGDKVLSEFERNDFLRHELVVEEKVDGANLGISFDGGGNIQVQNRGEYVSLPGVGQWKKLTEWLAQKSDTLFDCLSDRYILFGEWCYAQHSVFYDRLPDWFLGFDVYDKEKKDFVSTKRRNEFLMESQVCLIPQIACDTFKLSDLEQLMSQSSLGDQQAEGLYLRFDQDDWLIQRAKLVRPAFIQSVTRHWSRSGIKPNRLRIEVQA